jgi:hypothetical protein
MSIVTTKLMGGIGNYLFQIASSYAYSLKYDKKFICGTADIQSPHNNHTLYLNNILRKVEFTNSVPNYIHYVEPNFSYNEIPNFDSDIKLIGYFQSEKYFLEYKKEILEFFEIDPETSEYISEKYSNILNLDNCSLHVRRGDFVNLQNFHALQTIEYYKKSVDIIGEDKFYLIFSDDIDWCRENLSFIKNKTFITENPDYIDLYIMSLCKNNIIANSTFSWWGAWLNSNPNKKIVIPSKWFGINNLHLNTIDLYCDKWIKL